MTHSDHWTGLRAKGQSPRMGSNFLLGDRRESKAQCVWSIPGNRDHVPRFSRAGNTVKA